AEDDQIGFEYLNAILNDLNCELYHAANGAEAVELFNEKPDVDLILMDIRMPLMDGYQATRKIRETNNKVHIIAQTAFALAGDREKAMDAGCNDYIAKPINKKNLLQKINEFVLRNSG
ncbi:MAG TPA: hybrid sensor histidine kinase/response regulator, partial [Prolixibacteraceae bacterium]|nr:hybrid sensor histidine kinase/response regulator [Prolixibacteraceae bacterium]